MKTYKLIKTYPGSFPLGHLAILVASVKYYNLGTTTRSLDYIENHPEHWQHVCSKCHENINTCKPFGCKQPILITEDGVDVYEGDTVWHTNLNPNLKIYSSIVKNKTPVTSVKGLYSTKKAAEEYILMNKPCLSLQEIFDTRGNLLETRREFKAKLTKIVKQKLK